MTAFKPMLAKDGDPNKLSYPVVAQPKLDGIRISIVNGVPLTRTLKQVPNLEIRRALSDPRLNGLDGELVVGPPEAQDAYRRTSSFVMAGAKTNEPWAFHVFDNFLGLGGWHERWAVAGHQMEHALHTDLPIFSVPYRVIDSAEELLAYEADLLAVGHEGVIVRVPDAPYKFGRSGKTGPLLKVKRFVDFEATVIGVYEEQHNGNEGVRNALGRTERSTAKAGKTGKGTLGGLVLTALNGPWQGAEFRCGTGFDAAMRADFWAMAHRPPTLNGEVVKIKAFDVGSKDAPRHPVFLGFRDMEYDG
jgi:DNA ligase-1